RRDRGPDDLEARVPVDRRAVRVVVGAHAELDERVDDHRRDEREDRDADRGHKPEDEVDPAGLPACRIRKPGNEERSRRGCRAEHDSDRDELDDRSSAHRGRDYWTAEAARRRKRGGSGPARNACNEGDSASADPGTTAALTLRRFDGT